MKFGVLTHVGRGVFIRGSAMPLNLREWGSQILEDARTYAHSVWPITTKFTDVGVTALCGGTDITDICPRTKAP